jgi:hypothetical protein
MAAPNTGHPGVSLAIEFLGLALRTAVTTSMITARKQGGKLKLIGPVDDYLPGTPIEFERLSATNKGIFFTPELSCQVVELYAAIDVARRASPACTEHWLCDISETNIDWGSLNALWQPLNHRVGLTLRVMNKFDLLFGTDHASRSLEIQHVVECAGLGETPCIRSDGIVLIPGWLDLRTEARIPVGASVWLTTQNWRQRVTLKDLSVAGAGLASCPSLTLGADVTIELPSGNPLHGSVMWSIGGNIGVRFRSRLPETSSVYQSIRTLSRRSHRSTV